MTVSEHRRSMADANQAAEASQYIGMAIKLLDSLNAPRGAAEAKRRQAILKSLSRAQELADKIHDRAVASVDDWLDQRNTYLPPDRE